MSRIIKYDPAGIIKNMVIDIQVRDEVKYPPENNEIKDPDISGVQNILAKYTYVDLAKNKILEMKSADKIKIDNALALKNTQSIEDSKDHRKTKEKIDLSTDLVNLDLINEIHVWLNKSEITASQYADKIKAKYNTL